MRSQLTEFCQKEQLLAAESKLLVAISGGADSVCMAHLLQAAGYSIELAHCNFRLRGAESDDDEAFVRKFASSLNLTCHVTAFDTQEYAQQHGQSIEMAARELRYEWFEQLRVARRLDYVAVAHTQNDVVETFFINLVRGTGIRGLTGIKAKNQTVIRPILFASRAEVEEYCHEQKLSYRTDSSNLTNEYVRNKFRNTILPQIREINPSFNQSLSNTIERLADVEALFAEAVSLYRQCIVKEVNGALLLSCDALQQTKQLNTVLFEILSPYGFLSAQIPDIAMALQGQTGKQFFSPEYVLTKDREYFLLQPLVLPIHSEDCRIWQGANNCVDGSLLVEEQMAGEIAIADLTAHELVLDAQLVQFPLLLRRWKEGDRMKPFGMKGKSKKISDLLVDYKVPLSNKQKQLVLCAGNGEIIWLVALRSNHTHRVTASTEKIVYLRWQSAGK